jgi:putative membrane protein
MKTLILCVDRDDDLGAKGGVQTPAVGRRRVMDAAMALGLADPEDSDTNALLAAANLYDKELKALRPGDQLEVAAIAGHKALGLQADRRIAEELEEVLTTIRPDGVILVSDGADDEQVLPLLQSRAKVIHVHRTVVKQAPRLEGFYYVLTRILDDERRAKRFVLPFGIILLIWGLAYLFHWESYAWGATLAIAGLWLLIHAMKWEDRMSRFLHDLGKALRSGKLGLFAAFLMLVFLIAGVINGLKAVNAYRVPTGVTVYYPTLLKAVIFLRESLLFFIIGFLLQAAGGLFDAMVRERRAGMGYWTAIFGLIAFGLIADVVANVAFELLEGSSILDLVTFPRMVQLLAGLVLAMGGILLSRYVRSFTSPTRRAGDERAR